MESAPEDCSREDLVRIRRTALIEFEISRSPDAPNRTIAQACRTSPRTVAAIREASIEQPEGTSEQSPAGTLEHSPAGTLEHSPAGTLEHPWQGNR